MAYLRRGPMVPEMVGIKRVPSQSVLTRFFQGFRRAGANLGCFRRLFGWCLERLPSRKGSYALDLDSTRLLHEDGHQQSVEVAALSLRVLAHNFVVPFVGHSASSPNAETTMSGGAGCDFL